MSPLDTKSPPAARANARARAHGQPLRGPNQWPPPEDVPRWREDMERYYKEGDVHKLNQFRESNSTMFVALLSIVIPIVLLIFLWNLFRRTRDQIMGGGFLSGFSKSTAKRFEEGEQTTTFDDVAGLEGVKADLLEIVEFLHSDWLTP